MSRSRPEDRESDEVYYITPRNDPSEFPEDEGRVVPACDGGIYLDHLIILTATAKAMVKYADYWNVGTAKKLRDPRTGALGDWNDNGATIAFGGWPGTAAALIQHRHSL